MIIDTSLAHQTGTVNYFPNYIVLSKKLDGTADRIQTDRHRTGFSGKSGQKRDKDSPVRRRLARSPIEDGRS